MAPNNIIPLRGQNPLVQGVKQPNVEIITHLAELLQEAMEGELVGLAVASEYYDATVSSAKIGVISARLIGTMTRITQDMCRDLD